MQVNRVHVRAKHPAGHAAFVHRLHGVDGGHVQLLDGGGAADELAPVHVLVHHQADEIGVVQLVVEGEAHQGAQRGLGLHVFQAQARLDLANAPVSLFEHRQVQALFATKIVVNHALAGVGQRGDLVDARASQPLVGKLGRGHFQDVGHGAVRVVHPATFRRRCGSFACGTAGGRLAHQRSSNQFVHSQQSISEPQPASPPKIPAPPAAGSPGQLAPGWWARPWGPGRQAPGLVSAKLGRCISLSISLPRFGYSVRQASSG